MRRGNDHAVGHLLDYKYFSKHYKLIAIDLSKQIQLENPELKQRIIFIGRLDKIMLQCCVLLKNSKKQLFFFHKML